MANQILVNFDAEDVKKGNELQKKLGVRWSQDDWNTFRINEAEKRDRVARTEKDKSAFEPVRMHNQTDTENARRIERASFGDSTEARVQELIKAQLEKENQELRARLIEEEIRAKQMEELQPYL